MHVLRHGDAEPRHQCRCKIQDVAVVQLGARGGMPGPMATMKPGPRCVPGRVSGDGLDTVPTRGELAAVIGADASQRTIRSGR